MIFNENKPIFMQIAERICDEITQGTYKKNERIPSVREYAMIVEVNANTVMRAYEWLQAQDYIFNKRGIGYFVSEHATENIRRSRNDLFREGEMKDFFRKAHMLKITPQEIFDEYNNYLKSIQ